MAEIMVDPNLGFVTDTEAWVTGLMEELTQDVACSLDEDPDVVPEYLLVECIFRGVHFTIRVDFKPEEVE